MCINTGKLVFCDEKLLTSIIIRDTANQLMSYGSSSSTLTSCIMTITCILCTKRPIPVLFSIATIATQYPFIIWLIETSSIISSFHQWTIVLCQFSLCQSRSIILTCQGCSSIYSMCSIEVWNPAFRGRASLTTLCKQINSFLTILIDLLISLCKS